MKAIAGAGANYGLLLHWGKVEVMPVRCEAAIRKPDGSAVAAKASLVYLGSVITASSDMAAEIGRRLGAARADFASLERVWRHFSLSAQRKIRTFDACIASKLLYCLHTGKLGTQALRRVDAFQARCLRRILGIQHSYISHVPNSEVLRRAGSHKLSQTLLYRQLMLLRKVAYQPSGHFVHNCVFEEGSNSLKELRGPRKRGRPRKCWNDYDDVYTVALEVAGGRAALDVLWSLPSSEWKRKVSIFCFGA